MASKKWHRVAIRTIGVGNLLLSAVGLLFIFTILWGKHSLSQTSSSVNGEGFFWAMTIINFLFLTILIYLGIRLLQVDWTAVKFCYWVFGAEVAYFVLVGASWALLPDPMAMDIAGASGGGNMGIGPQILTGYPVVAAVVLILVTRRASPTNS